jgi:hypothetical protein
MTIDDRATALATFLSSPRHARFLTLAALHSGYFRRRQYIEWAGITAGCTTATKFMEILVRRGLARTFAVRRDRGVIYHITSPRIYAALGIPEHPNRRPHTLTTVLQRMMALDFVLAHPEYEFFPTAAEKVQRFTAEYAIRPDQLPTRQYFAFAHRGDRPIAARCFIETLPIFRRPNDPTVFFAYPWPEQTAAAFRTFLRWHIPLIEALPHATVLLLVSPQRATQTEPCHRVFNEMTHATLLRYFRNRAAWDRGEYASFPPERVWQLRQDEQRYAADRYQTLYRRWQIEGDPATRDAALPTFEVHELSHTFDQFGTWPTY